MKKKIVAGLVLTGLYLLYPMKVNDTYTYQQLHSLDWDNETAEILLKVGQYYGGDKYNQSYNMLIALNRAWDSQSAVAADIEDKISNIHYTHDSVEALKLVFNGYDPTFGNLEYKEV